MNFIFSTDSDKIIPGHIIQKSGTGIFSLRKCILHVQDVMGDDQFGRGRFRSRQAATLRSYLKIFTLMDICM